MKAILTCLTALGLLSSGCATQERAKAPAEKDMSAYLLVYFKDDTHSPYFALSSDGYTFTDVNNGKPIMDGKNLAEQKGIRDPHIARGPDGAFYLAMTDLHIFAQRDGLRSTEWERDGQQYGWGNNRGLVLMKSKDLINWTRSNVRVDKAFPGFEDIGCAWAPETIYDEKNGKMMIYFTMRFRNGAHKVYYAYTDNDFTRLETRPEVIFEYPKPVTYIDSDITKVGDKYRMFYVLHDGTPGIKQAASDSINTGYTYDPKWYDPEPKACEAPNVWKRIGEDKWVLMYDCYGINPHNFGFSETTDFTNFTNLGRFNEGVMKATNFRSPKHGSVIHLTQQEAKRLSDYWAAKSQTAAPNQNAAIRVQVGGTAKPISRDLIGVFFEDLNYAADGGLYAELVQNRSFDYSKADNDRWNSLSFWKLLESKSGAARVGVATQSPLHANNPQYAVLEVKEAGDRNGVSNEGFDGIVLKKGDQYDVSLFGRIFAGNSGKIAARLESPEGKVLGETQLTGLKADWARLSGVIESSADASNARLVILLGGTGTVGLDMVSLFPQKTFKNRPNGLRVDLAQAVADLKPKIVRFPGGCLVHGAGLGNIYDWKDTIGPVEQRKTQRNLWGYHQTVGLGYYEYFQFCEDIGAMPLPVVAAGVSCQFQRQQAIPMEAMDAYIQDVLDLIEWANGPATSKWGSKRAAAGHPAPFNLKYLGLGNEDQLTQAFKERYKMINDAIKTKHPEIVVIGTSGPFTDGEDFDLGWQFAKAEKIPMVDEHGYKSPNWYWENLERWDAYERNGIEVYLGEYAAHDVGRANTLRSALAEAAYLTAIERNGDLVRLTSYAPLLAKQGHTQWRPDMIYFDNSSMTCSINYYVQQMFGENNGDSYLPTTIQLPKTDQPANTRNGVILGTWNTQAEFDDVKIVSGTKEVLADSFNAPLQGWQPTSGDWKVSEGVYRQSANVEPATAKFVFDDHGTNYTISLRAKKTGGAEGFLIGFGVQDAGNYYWLNLGGWGNTAHRLEKSLAGVREPFGPSARGSIEPNRWYDIKIQVSGGRIECFLDSVQILNVTDRGFAPTPDLAASTVRDSATGDVIVKLVSKADRPTKATIDLSALGSFKAKAHCTVLTGDAAAENKFGQTPTVLPKVSEIEVGKVFDYEMPAHSLSVIRIKGIK